MMPESTSDPILRIEQLSMRYPIRGKGLFARRKGWMHAVNGVDLEIRAGEVLGLVGESGCGKTTLGRCIVRSEQPTAGALRYLAGTGEYIDLASITSTAALRRPATATEHRASADHQPPSGHRRRGRVGAGRVGARAGAEPAPRPAGRAR